MVGTRHVVMRLAVAVVATGLLGLAAAPAWGAPEPGVYWANAGLHAIGHAGLDGGGVDQEAVAGINYPEGVVLDEAHVYWTNIRTNTIGRADLDGANVDQNLIVGLNAPRDVAVDGGHIYWTNSLAHSIGRADLDGMHVEPDFIDTGIGSKPVGIAVVGEQVYWTDLGVGSGTGMIGRADVNGSNVDENLITGATSPEGVAADGGHVYWTNTTSDTLGRANLDGTGVNQSFIAGANGPVGIAIDGRHVYWANNDLDDGDPDTLGRANLDGTGVNQSFITGVDNPLGVAVMPVTTVTVPASLGFGSQTVGDAGGVELVSVQNTGSGTLRVTAASISGPDAADFEIAAGGDRCTGSPVPAGQSCTVGVRFKPSATGARAATLTIADNAQGDAQEVALTGVGAPPPNPSGPAQPPGPAKPPGPPHQPRQPGPGAHGKVTVKVLSRTVRHRRLRLQVRCSAAKRCSGEIRLLMRIRRGASRPAGQRGYAIGSGRHTISVRLNRRAGRALRQRGRLRITAIVSVGGSRQAVRATRTVRRRR